MLPEYIGDSFTPEKLLAVMDEEGVSQAILMQGSYYGFCNDYAHEAQEKYPDRLFSMGTFDPYARQAEAIMQNLVKNFRFRGFKFEMSEAVGLMGYHPDFLLDSPLMEKVWACVRANDLVVSLDLGTFGEASMQIDALRRLAARLPETSFMVEHIFLPRQGQTEHVRTSLEKLADYANIHFTLASIPTSTQPEAYPYPTARQYIAIAKAIVGVDRLIWGSDLPVVLNQTSYHDLIHYIQEDGLFSRHELKKIFHDNAARFYHLDH